MKETYGEKELRIAEAELFLLQVAVKSKLSAYLGFNAECFSETVKTYADVLEESERRLEYAKERICSEGKKDE